MNPDQFISPDTTALTQLRSTLQADLERIAAAASHALDFPKEAAFPSLQTGAIKLPQRISGGAIPLPPVFVTIPNWTNVNDMERGNGQDANTPDALGLSVTSVEDDSIMVGSEGDITSISPPVGTVVPSGSSVTVKYSRTTDPNNR